MSWFMTFMKYSNHINNWVGFHPQYILKNRYFFHCSDEILGPTFDVLETKSLKVNEDFLGVNGFVY